MEAGLYIVGTPLGNLGDITLRALETLREVDLIMAEDTRRTRRLLAHYDIHTRLLSSHRFNEERRAQTAVRRIRSGEAVALVTDAGMPGVSDPGSRTAAACRAAGLPVHVIPGPTAAAAALALSGMGGGGYIFAGFLPRRSGPRRRRLAELDRASLPMIVYESPHRLPALLADIEETMGSRRVFIARELTKRYEECISGTAAELRAHFSAGKIRGELTVVIAPDRSSPRQD